MTAHPNSASWQLKPRTPRKGHLEIKPDAPKHTLVGEMTVRANWVAEWQRANANGNDERARELEGLLGTNAISELERKG